MTFGLGREHTNEVDPGEQTCHTSVAAEEKILHTEDTYVIAAECLDQWAENLSSVAASNDGNGCIGTRSNRDRSPTPGRPISLGGAPSTQAKNPVATPVGVTVSPMNSRSKVRAIPMPSSCIGKSS